MSQDQISSGISGWCHATFIIIIYPKSLQSSCVLLPTPMNLAPLVSPAINFWRRDTAFLARKDSKTANSKPTAWQMNDFFDGDRLPTSIFLRGTCEFSEVVLPLNLWWLSAISGEPNKKRANPLTACFSWLSMLGGPHSEEGRVHELHLNLKKASKNPSTEDLKIIHQLFQNKKT